MDKSVLFRTAILPAVRHGLQLLSGYMVAQGQLDVANAETLAGGLLAIATVGWWWATRPKPAS